MAEKTKNLKIVTLADVLRVEVDNDGKASGVLYLKGGREYFQPARVVLLAGYTYENMRLLLLSTSKAYPNGLSNNHGQVGKHYIAHGLGSAGATGWFPGKRLNRYSGTIGQFTAFDDLDADNFDHTGLGFVGGGMCSATMEAKPIATASTLPPSAPRWGSGWKAWLAENADSVAGVGPQLEVLSYEDNNLDLDPVVRDPLGRPVIRITNDFHDNERRLFRLHPEEDGGVVEGVRRDGGLSRLHRCTIAEHARASAEPGWETTRTSTSSTVGACRTRSRTSASSAARRSRLGRSEPDADHPGNGVADG